VDNLPCCPPTPVGPVLLLPPPAPLQSSNTTDVVVIHKSSGADVPRQFLVTVFVVAAFGFGLAAAYAIWRYAKLERVFASLFPGARVTPSAEPDPSTEMTTTVGRTGVVDTQTSSGQPAFVASTWLDAEIEVVAASQPRPRRRSSLIAILSGMTASVGGRDDDGDSSEREALSRSYSADKDDASEAEGVSTSTAPPPTRRISAIARHTGRGDGDSSHPHVILDEEHGHT
jgi:hypothetical protein